MLIRTAIVAACAAVAVPAGCRSGADVNPDASPSGQRARAFPGVTGQPSLHDVQVFRESTKLRLTNTTAIDFGPSTLWVNRRFARDVDGFAPGRTLELPLLGFVDEYGEAFRAGGFFAARTPHKVVLVELETGGNGGATEMHAFVVVADDAN